MENNPAQPIDPQVVNPVIPMQPPVQPIIPQQPVSPIQSTPPSGNKKFSSKVLISVVAAIFLIILLITGGYLYLQQGRKTYNATVYNQSPIPTPSATPTPTGSQINPNDTSNQALNQDSKILDQNLSSASSDLNNTDQSFSDQQTNLQ